MGEKQRFSLQKSKKASKQGQCRKITYSQELQDKLVAWIMEKREFKFVAVSTQMMPSILSSRHQMVGSFNFQKKQLILS